MTNETKRTPGKMWQALERYPHSYAIVDCDEYGARGDIAWLGQSASRSNEENHANARLIACAPELLEALEEATKILCDHTCGTLGIFPADKNCIVCDNICKYKQLIARAKGEKEHEI